MNLISNITFNATNVFFPAIFPGLAANTVEVRQKRAQFIAGKLDLKEVEQEDGKQRNRIILWATVGSNVGYVGTLVICNHYLEWDQIRMLTMWLLLWQ